MRLTNLAFGAKDTCCYIKTGTGIEDRQSGTEDPRPRLGSSNNG